MSKQSIKRIALLSLWSIIYIILCIFCINFIGLDFDFKNRYIQNIICLCSLLSIPVWFVLLCGFSKFDGSSEKWWSKILYNDLFPYPDKKPHGSLFRDVVFPTLLWSIFFPIIGPALLLFAIVVFGVLGYILLYNPMDFIFHKSLLGFIAFISLLFIAFILTVVHKNELGRPNIRYDYLAVLRTLFCVNISIIGYILLLIGIVECYFDISSFITIFKVNDYDLIELGTVLFKPFINLLPGGLVLYYCRRELNCFLYAEDSYYLYLRSFQFDDKEDSLLKWLPAGGKQIMKIGNPSSRLFPNILSNRTMYHDVLFLPSSNWKKHLDYYIYKAFSVISVVDDTQGVVWEMFHHSEYYHKIVFYVDSNEKLCKLETMVSESEDFKSSPLLYYCINHLNKLKITTPFVFWIKGNRCYYDTVNVVSSLLSTKLDCTSKLYFDIDTAFDKTISDVALKDADEYKKWNKTSSFLSLLRKVFSVINAKFPLALYILAIIGSFLFCCILLIGFVWVGVEFIIQGHVFNGILGVILGLGIIILVVYGWYKLLFK